MRRVLLALAAGLLVALGIIAPARAQEQEPLIDIRSVDATDPAAVEVTFFYGGDRADLSGLTVREGGDIVETTTAVPFGESEAALGVVLAIDSSRSMATGALIERVKEAAIAFVEGKAPADQIAIVSFSGEVLLVEDFTTDADELTAAIEAIPLDTGTAVYDAIVRAAGLFRESELQPNIVVFSDGADADSSADSSRAQAAVTNAGATLFAIGVDNPAFASVASIADESGGAAASASDPDAVGEVFGQVQETLRNQYVVTYASEAESGPVPIQLTVGSATGEAEFVAGSAQEGAASLRPVAVEEPSGPFGLPAPDFLRSSTGLMVAIGLVALAGLVAVYSIGSSFFGNDTSLGQALRPYAEGYVADPDAEDDDGKGQQFAQTPLLQRAVEATGTFAEQRGFLTKVESLLEKANLPLRPAEAIFFYAAGVAVIALLLFGVAGSPIAALVGVLLVALIPPAVVSYLGNRRRKQFESLLPDTLQLLASTMRAGYSLMQGVEAVSQEVSEPMGRELRRVVTEARLGRPLEEALDGIAGRMESPDFAWAVMAIRIQREVGGNLAELLVTVAETMTERERLRRDVNALTAEGKISAIVLGILPLGLGGFIFSLNPEYMDPLFDTGLGQGLLVGSVLLAFFGFWWMKKTVQVDI